MTEHWSHRDPITYFFAAKTALFVLGDERFVTVLTHLLAQVTRIALFIKGRQLHRKDRGIRSYRGKNGFTKASAVIDPIAIRIDLIPHLLYLTVHIRIVKGLIKRRLLLLHLGDHFFDVITRIGDFRGCGLLCVCLWITLGRA